MEGPLATKLPPVAGAWQRRRDLAPWSVRRMFGFRRRLVRPAFQFAHLTNICYVHADRRRNTVDCRQCQARRIVITAADEFQAKSLIDGNLALEGEAGLLEAISPVDGEVVGRMPRAGSGDVDRAVRAAQSAFKSAEWSGMSLVDRGRLIRGFGELLEANGPELALLEARDGGKPRSYTMANDVQIALQALDFAVVQNRLLAGGHESVMAPDHIRHRLTQPVGVVAELLPWNGPIWTGVQRLAAILSAGCTAVVKPSELGSLTFARIAELLLDAGLPDGVINVVYGEGDVGSALVSHPGIDAVSLTGGTATGARVLEQIAKSIKPVTLELGGKNAMVVLEDADIGSAAMWAAVGGYGNAGQVCVAASRVLVAESQYERFTEELISQATAIGVGDPTSEDSEMGTLIAHAHADAVWAAIESRPEGSALVAGGRPYEDDRVSGAFVPPTVIADLPADSELVRREIFGPVITVESFRDPSEAVAMANETVYGLSAGLFTRDVDLAWEISARLNAGEVYVNRWFSPGVLEAPLVGQRQSGFGQAGIESYLKRTNVFFERSGSARALSPEERTVQNGTSIH